jgi:hypothetical protein
MTGVEALAKIFHPELAVSDEVANAFHVMSRPAAVTR